MIWVKSQGGGPKSWNLRVVVNFQSVRGVVIRKKILRGGCLKNFCNKNFQKGPFLTKNGDFIPYFYQNQGVILKS